MKTDSSPVCGGVCGFKRESVGNTRFLSSRIRRPAMLSQRGWTAKATTKGGLTARIKHFLGIFT